VQAAASPTAETQADPYPKLLSGMAPGKMFVQHGSDALNLAGLLNVLDGVVDTPGRLLVLSTNHPEVLDPALIRPGRINR
jgi:ATP-dependent Zn protease